MSDRDQIDRRRFLASTFGATVLASLPASLMADTALPPVTTTWDSGQVRHLLPTVSDSEILIKASFTSSLSSAPSLKVGSATVRGRMNDTQGEFWQFHATDLQPGRRYNLMLAGSNGRFLCEPWPLSTFPARDSRPEHFRGIASSSGRSRSALTPSSPTVIMCIGIFFRRVVVRDWAPPKMRSASRERSCVRRSCSARRTRLC